MSAVLFGSIGTIADTSEMSREAFNDAFAQHGLDWHWSQDEYRELLASSGGADRVAAYAKERGEDVDATAIHATKSELFQHRVAAAALPPRAGVAETLAEAKRGGHKVGLVTTTAHANIDALLESVGAEVQASDFDVVVDIASVEQRKPDKAAYVYALEQLGEDAADCVAIEDNVGGVESARAAGLDVVAFPGENNAGHDFGAAAVRVDELAFSTLQPFIPSA